MGITRELARYLVETGLDDIPPEVRERAKAHILDTLGVTVAGTTTEAARIAREYVGRLGGRRRATVLGTPLRTSPPLAALANGVAAHSMDYDDTSFLLIAHTSGSSVAALLALGEEMGSPGRDFLEAFILGYELAARLGKAVMPHQYTLGWHTTGTLGTLCATACCAKLAGLGEEATARALGVASSMAAGIRGNFGTHTKPLHTGAAAKNAVMAVSLVREGFTGNPDIFDHHYGYLTVTVGAEKVNPKAVEEALRDRDTWYLTSPGIGIKLHPCNSAVLPGIDSTIELVREHDIRPEDVEVVEYGHTDLARTIVPFDDPKNSPEAMYSMTHAIAVAIVYRRAGIREFSEECVHDPAVRAMRARVRPYEHPSLGGTTDGHDVPASYVTIRLKDGRSFTRFRPRPKAYPGGEPLTRGELLEKFADCVTLVLPRGRVKRCVDMVDNLEQVGDVGEIARVLSLRR